MAGRENQTRVAADQLAVARQEWDEALHLAEIAIQHSRDRDRVKYQVLDLKTCAQALAALHRTHEAIVDLRNALALDRSSGDPALFVNVAAFLLAVESDDAQRISAALPNDAMRRLFATVEPVQTVAGIGG